MALFTQESSEVDKEAKVFVKTVEFYEQFLIARSPEELAEMRMCRRYLTTKGSFCYA